MTDIFSSSKRSHIMSKVRAKNTKPELLVRKFLFSKGFRYRLHQSSLPGNPDIVLKKYRTIILVHGCFWHGHKTCPKSRLPTSNTMFWSEKIQSNIKRDKKTKALLKEADWFVLTIWECEIKNKLLFNRTMQKLLKNLKSAHRNN